MIILPVIPGVLPASVVVAVTEFSGPLIGKVIGIVTMKLNRNGDVEFDDMNFAIPISYALNIADEIMKNGSIEYETPEETETAGPTPVLGVTARVQGLTQGQLYYHDVPNSIVYDVLTEENESETKYYYVPVRQGEETETGTESETEERVYISPDDTFTAPASGVMILTVAKGTGADGVLKPGDIVMEVYGQAVDNVYMVKYIAGFFKPGDTLPLRVFRDGEVLDLEVVLSAPTA